MDSKKTRRRYTLEEKSELVVAYQSSGLSQKAWCSAHHISMNSLHKWIQSANVDNNKSLQGWASVEIKPHHADCSSEPITLRIGKCTIAVSANTNQKLLSDVLQMLVPLC